MISAISFEFFHFKKRSCHQLMFTHIRMFTVSQKEQKQLELIRQKRSCAILIDFAFQLLFENK